MQLKKPYQGQGLIFVAENVAALSSFIFFNEHSVWVCTFSQPWELLKEVPRF